jgi:molecular chaperone GrpE
MSEELNATPPSPPEGTSDPDALLKAAEAKVQELHDAWLRAKAETENVRKRAQADIVSAHKFATENFAESLLPVKDSLEAALAADSTSPDSLKSGVELTLRQLVAAFDKANIKEINAAGEKFDPNRHQAIHMVEAEAEPNSVISIMQKGYLLHDRVLRPALVAVAKPKTKDA